MVTQVFGQVKFFLNPFIYFLMLSRFFGVFVKKRSTFST